MESSRAFFGVPREYQALLEQLGLTAAARIFDDPRIVPWRSIPERENCTLDATLADGRAIRLHIKRYRPTGLRKSPGEQEADGILALELAGIPTAPLVAWGKLEDGRSFLVTEDLAGFAPADRLIEAGTPFDRLLEPTADLAARLHGSNLHHRDLYLCHFFVKLDAGKVELRLIDPARVRHLPIWPLRQRWIVKDLAQFWYSTLALPISDRQRQAWMAAYGRRRGIASVDGLVRSVIRKSDRIARHDAKLRRSQPGRNISIPQGERQ